MGSNLLVVDSVIQTREQHCLSVRLLAELRGTGIDLLPL